MADRVARYVQNPHRVARKLEFITLCYCEIESGQAFGISRCADDLRIEFLAKRLYGINVVAVVMRDQDAGKGPSPVCQDPPDRSRFRRVYQRGLAGLWRMYQKCIIVRQAWDRYDVQRHGVSFRTGYGVAGLLPIRSPVAMHLDVLDLRNFYYRTGLGRAAKQVICTQISGFWPSVNGETVVGFGFAAPLLRPFLDSAARVICLMPAPQGIMPWPPQRPNASVLCEETLWPLPNGEADRLVLLHGLETSENPTRLLDECRRVLAPGGKALFIVPNRTGLWARRDGTPFGFGRPYSLGQLESQLRRRAFTPERRAGVLFQPPSNRSFWLRTGPFWERAGQRITRGIAGGVLLVEARKDVYASERGLPEAVKRPMRILEGIAIPEAKPV